MKVTALLRKKARRCDGLLREVYKDVLREAVAERKEHRVLTRMYGNDSRLFLNEFGEVGRLILLLYCANLFSSDSEQEKCILASHGLVTKQDLHKLLEQVSLSCFFVDEVDDILERVTATSYFTKEDLYTVSRVLKRLQHLQTCLKKQLTSEQFEEFTIVCKKIIKLYEAEPFLHYCNRKSNVNRDAGNMRPKFARVDHEELMMLAAAVKNNTALSSLMASRPPESVLPHAHAALMCAEHGMLWLKNSALRIFYPLQISYAQLRKRAVSRQDEASLEDLWKESRLPSGLDRFLHNQALYLLGMNREKEGDLHYLQPEHYPSCLKADFAALELAAAKMMMRPFRCKPEILESESRLHASVMVEVVHEFWTDEPPQYAHLFRYCSHEHPRVNKKLQLKRRRTSVEYPSLVEISDA